MARNQNWKAGLFIIASTLLLVLAIALIAGLHMGPPQNRYTILFSESVSGLEAGAAVKYRGVDVGTVDAIRIPKEDITKVEVAVSIGEKELIRSDTKAVLGTVGITGIKYIDLRTGSTESPILPPGSIIPSETSLLETLGSTAQTAAEKVDILLENMLYMTDREKIDRIVARIDSILGTVETMEHAGAHVDSLVLHLDLVLDRNEGRIDSSLVKLNKVLTGADRMFGEIERTNLLENVSAAASSAREAATDLHSIVTVNRRTISETLINLRETSSNLNDFSRFIRDRPSLLLRSSAPKEPNLPGAK